MAARLRLPTLALAALSIGLNFAILGCAARTLHVYNTEEAKGNAFFLPVWHQHFDTRGLSALIGTSIGIMLLNGLTMMSLLVPWVSRMNVRVIHNINTEALVVAPGKPHHLDKHDSQRRNLNNWAFILIRSQ